MSAIKLLLLEDNDLDAQLTLRELRGMEHDFETKIVSEKNEFEEAVIRWSPDLIISDFNLQTFNGDEALAFAKKNKPGNSFYYTFWIHYKKNGSYIAQRACK